MPAGHRQLQKQGLWRKALSPGLQASFSRLQANTCPPSGPAELLPGALLILGSSNVPPPHLPLPLRLSEAPAPTPGSLPLSGLPLDTTLH